MLASRNTCTLLGQKRECYDKRVPFQTLPGRLRTPPRRQTSSNTSVFRSADSAPLTSTETPFGFSRSILTEISTRPEIGGRSGIVIFMHGELATAGPNRDSEVGALSGGK